MSNFRDTIYALSTPPGKSAIAVIRISGGESINILKKISLAPPKKTRTTTLSTIIDGKNKIDNAICVIYKAPNSYTGEDMVELSLHGGSAVIKKMLEILKKQKDSRLAEKGEFTKRSLLNNKLDLNQVEGIADIINSETEAQRKQAFMQLQGKLSLEIKKISNLIKGVLANIEATIDFSDEELPKNMIKKTKEQIKNIISKLHDLLKSSNIGTKIRNGFVVSVVGKPNTGKSTFINYIAQREIAIVTDIPGTTRDAIEVFADFNGTPIKFYDTAGIRKPSNKVEKMGISKTYKIIENADINLVFISSLNEMKKYNNIKNAIFIKSKLDKHSPIIHKNIINISGKTGKGCEKIFKKITKKLNNKSLGEEINVSRERHIIAIEKTLENLEKSNEFKNYDLFAEDIRRALIEISKISGKNDVEDILEIIFNDFCIGK